MQLNLDPIVTLLSSQVVSADVSTIAKDYSMFTTIGVMVSVTSSVALVASVKVEVSLDGINWGEYSGSSVAITGDVNIPYNISEFAFNKLRLSVEVTSGSAMMEIKAIAKQG
jgi:hypothetical protein